MCLMWSEVVVFLCWYRAVLVIPRANLLRLKVIFRILYLHFRKSFSPVQMCLMWSEVMALRLQTPSQTFLLTHTTAKYLCALCTVHSAVHQVDFAHFVHCTLRSVFWGASARLHWCHTPKSSLLASLNCDRDPTTPPPPPHHQHPHHHHHHPHHHHHQPQLHRDHHQLPLHPRVERQGGRLLQRLVRDIYGAFTPPPFHSETLTPPFTPPPSPKTISELDT